MVRILTSTKTTFELSKQTTMIHKAASTTELLSYRHPNEYGSSGHMIDDDHVSSTNTTSSTDDLSDDDEDDYELCQRCGRAPKEQALAANQLPCLCKKSCLLSRGCRTASSLKNLKEFEREKKRICERNSIKMDPCYFQVHSGVQVQMPDMNNIEETTCGIQHGRFGSFHNLRS
jgi:hypothetical protein